MITGEAGSRTETQGGVAVAGDRAGRSRAVRFMDFLFFATVFCVTFEKLHWDVAGSVSVSDVLALVFLGAFALGRVGLARQALPRTVAVVGFFLAAFLIVYLAGFYNLDSSDALHQFVKGLAKFLVHFLFLGAGIAYVVRRG